MKELTHELMFPQQNVLNTLCLPFLSHNGTQLENDTFKEICFHKVFHLKHTPSEWYLLSYLLRKVLLEKLISFQLVKKFSAFYGNRRFIIAITRARHLPISWASSNQSIPPHPTSRRSILTVSSDLCMGLFPSGFPTKILYTPPPPCAVHVTPMSFSILSPEQCWVAVQCPPKDTRTKYVRSKGQDGLRGAPDACCCVNETQAQHSNHKHCGKNYRIHNTFMIAHFPRMCLLAPGSSSTHP